MVVSSKFHNHFVTGPVAVPVNCIAVLPQTKFLSAVKSGIDAFPVCTASLTKYSAVQPLAVVTVTFTSYKPVVL